MKLTFLLAKYFYQQRQLRLPGIGVFRLDAAVTVPDVADKNFKEFLKYIQFSQEPVAQPEESLIDFIRVQTGKIRPLAESDLESYLNDGKLLLNIGKPFTIEGIGSLHKNKSGTYEFTPGEPILERLESALPQAKEAEKQSRQIPAYDDNIQRHSAHNNQRRLLMLGTLVVIGLAVIVWGGYYLYNKNNSSNASTDAQRETLQQVDSPEVAGGPDSVSHIATADSAPQQLAPAAGTPAGSYKFILERTDRKARALKRFAFVNDLSPRIKMETSDSLNFTIYVNLPAAPADTARLKDSLNVWYYGTKPVKVEIAK
ncbi:MAG: hypothetical protein P0Y53_21605 [Candidatus Pseudobacter hemicellulosilyticus]|uniref:CCDC81-like prokaryotic HU domain-containing protein n=1 Tax=Candidatus Pseudobacter hemicellulosilyticus TaxID=3121375 RepID=A0AAJ5WPY9_9BACT|nr:MAG: hypothetical protein P0Y53_21605 [Pseudobacter sp.]